MKLTPFPALLLAGALLAAGCSGGSDAARPTAQPAAADPAPTATPVPTATATPVPSPTATSKPTPTATPEPTPTPTPEPQVSLPLSYPRQGGFLVARLSHPPQAEQFEATFAGSSYPMIADGPDRLAVIGLATNFTVGDYALEIRADGETLASRPVSVTDGGFERITLEVEEQTFDLLTDQEAIEEERRTVEETYSTYTPQRLWSGPWLAPLDGSISNPFGVQRFANGELLGTHGGADIVAEGGTPVVAAASGRVALARELYLLGNSVIIDHGAGVLSGYHHLSSIAALPGQTITKGDLVGYVGTTGFSTGDHLHWEARIHGVRVDPFLFTQAPPGP